MFNRSGHRGKSREHKEKTHQNLRLCSKKIFSLYLSSMKFIFPIPIFIFLFCGCDKRNSTSRIFKTDSGDITVLIASQRHYDSGITGAPHAPVFIPYVNKEISGSVCIAGKQDTIEVDNLADVQSLLSKSGLQEILDKVSITASPDGNQIAYTRESSRGDNLCIVHTLPDGKMFYSGYYDKNFRQSLAEKKDFDWKTIPSSTEIAKRMLQDSVSDDERDVAFETVLLNEKHPSPLDNFALENFGGNNLATTYIEILVTDSVLNSSSPDWKKKLHDQVHLVCFDIENAGKDFDETNFAREEMEALLAVQRNTHDISLMEEIDSTIMRLSFISAGANIILLNRKNGYEDANEVPENSRRAFSDAIEQYYSKLAMEKIRENDTNANRIIDMACYIGDSLLTDRCAEALLRNWPEKSNPLTVSPLSSDYYAFSEVLRDKICAKAEKYIGTKYEEDMINFLWVNSNCDQLFALRKKYPGKFDGVSQCDTTSSN